MLIQREPLFVLGTRMPDPSVTYSLPILKLSLCCRERTSEFSRACPFLALNCASRTLFRPADCCVIVPERARCVNVSHQ